MSTTEEAIRVKILDAKKAATELKLVTKAAEDATGMTSEHGSVSDKAAKSHEHATKSFSALRSALSYGGGLLGLSAVGYGLKDVFQGGQNMQEQQALLRNSLRDTGQSGSKHLGQLNKAIEQSSSTGGFGVLEEAKGLSELIRLTGSSTTAIKVNREAVELSRGTHMGYSRALTVVDRIQTGQTGRLQQYLGIIQPVTYYVKQLTAQEKKLYPERLKNAELADKRATAEEANRRILERYSGSAEAYGKTAAGAVSNANNSFKLATEELGEKFLPVVTDVAKGFTSMILEVKSGKGTWGDVATDIEKTTLALKSAWEWVENSKAAVKGLEVVLGILAASWGVDKVLEFYSAVRKLTVIAGISRLLGMGGLAGSEAEAAGEAGGLGGAMKASLLPEIAALGISLGIAYTALKGIRAVAEYFHPGELKSHSQKEVENQIATGTKHSSAELRAKGGGGYAFGKHPELGGHAAPETAAGKEFRQRIEERNQHLIASDNSQRSQHIHLHTHVMLDGRQLAESVTHYTLKRQARQ